MISSESRVAGLRRAIGASTLLLVGVTWPLWKPVPSAEQIPWLGLLRAAPALVDWIASGLALIGALGLVVGGKGRMLPRASGAAYLVGFGLLVSLDQHRLQPWAWQFLILAAILSLAPASVALNCGRWLTISIYFYSALSKADLAFLHVQGQWLAEALWGAAGLEMNRWSKSWQTAAAAILPVGEFCIAILLLFRRTRGIGLLGSLVMHITLLLVLGLVLRQEWGVLIWNVFFLVQNVLLFWRIPNESPKQAASQHLGAIRLAQGLTMAVVLWPLLEGIGYCDHWPAWAVYSARPARVRILLDPAGVSKLPDSLAEFVGDAPPLDERRPFSLEAWSFATRHAPIYPQLRYKLALASALLPDDIDGESVTVMIGETPSRWTGERRQIQLQGRDDIRRTLERFQLNTSPRRVVPRGAGPDDRQ